MTIGLDLGSFQFRSLRSVGERLAARCCPAVFTTVSDTPAHRRLLQQSNTRFVMCSEQLLVLGHAAEEWAAMLNLPLVPLLRSGRIPVSDPISRQLLTLIIDALLPTPDSPGTLCRMNIPGGGQDDRIDNRDSDFFQQLVALRGYRPHLMTASQALALAEFNDVSFTGIAITLGHSTSEFGVVHCGREIVRCSVMSGLESFEDAPKLDEPGDAQGQVTTANIDREYLRFFQDIVVEARTQFDQDRTIKTLPPLMPVVVAGGITDSPSFLPMFQKAWDASDWPVTTRPIRVAKDPRFAVARGCLIQAELDQPSEQRVA